MTQPLKRSEHIVQLSKEHHLSLLFCWKVRSGLKKDIDMERLINYIDYFWENHLLPHFSEEDILFASINDNAMIKRAYAEHREINGLVKRLTSANEKEKMQIIENIANIIENHVRFEERELFPHLEKEIEESALAKIGRKLSAMQPEPFQDTFKDEFWKES